MEQKDTYFGRRMLSKDVIFDESSFPCKATKFSDPSNDTSEPKGVQLEAELVSVDHVQSHLGVEPHPEAIGDQTTGQAVDDHQSGEC